MMKPAFVKDCHACPKNYWCDGTSDCPAGFSPDKEDVTKCEECGRVYSANFLECPFCYCIPFLQTEADSDYPTEVEMTD